MESQKNSKLRDGIVLKILLHLISESTVALIGRLNTNNQDSSQSLLPNQTEQSVKTAIRYFYKAVRVA